jgi:dienelactone hydrolase
VTIESPDGVKLVGSFYSANKPNSPALLMLHQWESDRHSFDDLAATMQADGFNVLTVDGRGFGESTTKANGSAVSAGKSQSDVDNMLGDVGAAFDFLSKNPNVDPKRIGILGASYGSSLALLYAAGKPEVAAIAMLSPGLDYFGHMKTEPAFEKYGNRPAYMMAAEDDGESANAIRKLNPITSNVAKYEQTIHARGGHGTALLNVEGVTKELEDYFIRRLRTN